MLQLSASCICNAEAQPGINQDNLLFAGQLLPEKNGGLSGTPTLKLPQDQHFVAAVLDGSARGGEAAAHAAAAALRDAADAVTNEAALAAQLSRAEGCAAACICVRGDRLYLADRDDCRAYLLRERSLYLLSAQQPGQEVHTASGLLRAGDALLLCSDGVWRILTPDAILTLLSQTANTRDAIQLLLKQVRAAGGKDTVTAVMLRAD